MVATIEYYQLLAVFLADLPMHTRFLIGIFYCSFACLFLLSLGCGTSSYRNRMEARLEELREIEANQPPVTPNMLYEYIMENQLQGEKRFNLRIPRVFSLNGEVFHEQTTSRKTSEKYAPARLWPLGVKVPGYYWTYEAIIPDGATKPISGTPAETSMPANQQGWSYSFCFGAQALTEAEASEVMFEYRDELNAVLEKTPNAKPAQIDMENVASVREVVIPNLGNEEETVSWKVIHQEGDLFFTSYKGTQEDGLVRKPGVLEIYTTYHKDHLVILASTWVQGMESATLMKDFLPVVAASVQIVEDNSAAPTE